MSKAVKLMKDNASNPKLWIALGIGVVGVVILTETHRRRRRPKATQRVDFGTFVVRFDLLPFPQPPPPAARLPLASLTFAIKDMFVFSSPTLSFSFPDFTVEFRFLFLNFYMNRKQTSFLYGCRVFHKIGWGLLVLKKN